MPTRKKRPTLRKGEKKRGYSRRNSTQQKGGFFGDVSNFVGGMFPTNGPVTNLNGGVSNNPAMKVVSGAQKGGKRRYKK